MAPGRGRRLYSAALGCALAAAVFATTAAAKVPADFFGIKAAEPPSPNDVRRMAASGIESYKLAISWRRVEPEPPVELAGQTFRSYDFSGPDAEIRRAIAEGLSIHAVLIGTPFWVAKNINENPMRSARGRAGWPDYVAAVVTRYGPGGEFWRENPDLPMRPPIAYEIWNEMNSEINHAPRADPGLYAKLLRLAGREIRRLDPGAEIVTGGMFGTPQLDKSIYAWKFLKQLFRKRNVDRYVDAVGIHPYAGKMWGVRFQLRKFRRALKQVDERRMPLQVTEIGWSSARRGGVLFHQGPVGQARLTNKALRQFTKKRRKWRIERVLWFVWRDIDRGSGCHFCHRMGLLKQNGKPKRAYHKFVKYSRR